MDQKIVAIEFKRIQEFLFTVPRLREILGANVILGELIRIELPKLAVSSGSIGCDVLSDEKLNSPTGDPLNSAVDQLGKSEEEKSLLKDDVIFQMRRGILSRDGGHFRAIFEADKVPIFVTRAVSLIEKTAPGLTFSVHAGDFDEQYLQMLHSAQSVQLVNLPQFQVCHETGLDVAVDVKTDRTPIGDRSRELRKAGSRFVDPKEETSDIIGLLHSELAASTHATADVIGNLASNSNYLALLQADGNQIGARFKRYMERHCSGLTGLEWQVRAEHFFWHVRTAFRKAIVEALNTVYGTAMSATPSAHMPYQLLMLGGDDLLLVTSPDRAFEFSVELSRQLEQTTLDLEGESALTIGIGVAVTHVKYPFHALQSLAEQLVSNAKTETRVVTDESVETQRSVIDWQITSNSWVDDPVIDRQNHLKLSYESAGNVETLACTQKPYSVLRTESGSGDKSLEKLMCNRDKLRTFFVDGRSTARSQLKRFAHTLRQGGRLHGLLSFEKMPEKGCRDVLKDCGYSDSSKVFSERVDDEDRKHFFTDLIDLIELYDLDHLGVQDNDAID